MTPILSLMLLAQAVSEAPAAEKAPSTSIAPVVVTAHREPIENALTKMRCTVTVQGGLRDCVLVSEEPPGRGYGVATLRTARLFRVKPAMRDGMPVESQITIPMRWMMDDSKPATPPAASPAAPPDPEPK